MAGSSDRRAQVACPRTRRRGIAQRKDMVSTRTVGGTACNQGERRAVERRRLYRGALLSIPGQIVAQPCRLRDLTVKGAGIRLNGIILLPLTFELSLDAFHTMEPCRLVWRDGDFAGVIFLAPTDLDRAIRSS